MHKRCSQTAAERRAARSPVGARVRRLIALICRDQAHDLPLRVQGLGVSPVGVGPAPPLLLSSRTEVAAELRLLLAGQPTVRQSPASWVCQRSTPDSRDRPRVPLARCYLTRMLAVRRLPPGSNV